MITRLACACLALCLLAPVSAQESATELRPLPAELAARFDSELAQITAQQEDLGTIERRAAREDGYMADLLSERRDRLWTAMFRDTVDLATDITLQRRKGYDVSAWWAPVEAELAALPDDVLGAIERISNRTEFPEGDLSTRDFVIADRELFAGIETQDALFRALYVYLQVSGEYGLDSERERGYLVDELTDHAANLSVFLLRAQADIEVLSDAVVTLPNDTELAEWLSAADARIRMTADAMQDTVALMDDLGLETRIYRQQLLTATGEITADVLDVGLVAGLIAEWAATSKELLANEGPQLLFRLLLVVAILFGFAQLGKIVRKLADRALSSSRVTMSHLLKGMIVSTIGNIIMLFGILIAISQLGISLGPLLAGLGIAGFIIGFALQDTLSNFASGVMILLYRPFDVGDTVRSGEVSGKVSHMSLVNTTFLTFDNQRLIVPNNMIWGSVITNLTAQYTRRVDLVFNVSYEDDLDKVDKILHEIVEAHEACLDSPEPLIRVQELADSGVTFIVRPWVKTEDYWTTYWDLTKIVKQRFDEAGITIPYPQSEVRIVKD